MTENSAQDSLFIAEKVKHSSELLRKACAEMSKICFGQDDIIRLTIACMVAGGNVLAEGVPGVGKTHLVSNLAKVMGLDFKRVQFTSDLMPSDIIGPEVLDTKTGETRFVKGPIFTQFLMADEINRASPKTQGALLEAMQEHRVTVNGTSHELPRPFQVMATQNPGWEEGTNPLPTAQSDRFLMRLDFQYPDEDSEKKMAIETTMPTEGLRELYASNERGDDITKTPSGKQRINIKPVLGDNDLIIMQELAKHIAVSQAFMDAASKIVRGLRPGTEGVSQAVNDSVERGPGPRATLAFVAAARALAVMDGKIAVDVSYIKEIALPLLQHRVIMRPGKDANDGFRKLLDGLTNKI